MKTLQHINRIRALNRGNKPVTITFRAGRDILLKQNLGPSGGYSVDGLDHNLIPVAIIGANKRITYSLKPRESVVDVEIEAVLRNA